MFQTFFGAIGVGLVLFALLTLCYGAFLKLSMPKKHFKYYLVIPAKRSDHDVCAAAYAARMKMSLFGDEDFGSVVVLDCGMEESQKLVAENICRGTNGIYLCDYKTFEDLTK